MGVKVHAKGYEISGTIECPHCHREINLSDPEEKKESPKKNNIKSTSRHNLNAIGWSVIIAIIAGFLISHFLQ